YAAATKQADDIVAYASQKGVGFWKALGMLYQGIGSALTGNVLNAVQKINSAINFHRSMGSTLYLPECLAHLANAQAQLGQVDDAERCIGQTMTAMQASGEIWCEAEVNRVAGEIALISPERDTAKAQAYFKRALSIARQQQAKSWELRAAMSLGAF